MSNDLVTHHFIECKVCGSKEAYTWRDTRLHGYRAYCPQCDEFIDV